MVEIARICCKWRTAGHELVPPCLFGISPSFGVHPREPFSWLSQGIGWKCKHTSLSVLKANVTRLGATQRLKGGHSFLFRQEGLVELSLIPSEQNNWGWAKVVLTRLLESNGVAAAQSPNHCNCTLWVTILWTFPGRIHFRSSLCWGYAPFPVWCGYNLTPGINQWVLLDKAKDRARRCYEKAGFRVASGSAASWGRKTQHTWSEWQKLRKVPPWSCCPQETDEKINNLGEHIVCFFCGS